MLSVSVCGWLLTCRASDDIQLLVDDDDDWHHHLRVDADVGLLFTGMPLWQTSQFLVMSALCSVYAGLELILTRWPYCLEIVLWHVVAKLYPGNNIPQLYHNLPTKRCHKKMPAVLQIMYTLQTLTKYHDISHHAIAPKFNNNNNNNNSVCIAP